MPAKINLNSIFARSDDVVAREVQEEIIIVPLTAAVVDMEDSLYSLDETGRAIWDRLDGKRTLKAIVQDLAAVYATPEVSIANDVLGFMDELHKRKLVNRV